MKFIIHDRIDKAFPGMKLAVGYGEGLNNTGSGAAVLAALREAEDSRRAGWTFPNAQSHPAIGCWRVAMKRNGVSADFPCAIESLVRQVISGRPLANINPAVNLGNLDAIAHLAPVGLFSADQDIHLRQTREGELFTELGRSAPVSVKAGEICYATPGALITRHFVWRQSEEAKVTERTTRFFFVSEVLPEAGADTAERILASFAAHMETFFGIRMETAILTAEPIEYAFASTAVTEARA
jgi:DNA/RNA-binding domain of Phe-tRNA-synthetase-like protein